MGRIVTSLAFVPILLAAGAASAEVPAWTVSEAAGTVAIRSGNEAVPARRGTTVPAGAILTTGPGSRAVVFRGKDFMTVSANSRVRLPTPQEAGGSLFDVLQEWGNALFQIEKKPVPHFGVRTPIWRRLSRAPPFP